MKMGMNIPNQYDQFIKDPQLLENSLSNLNLKSWGKPSMLE